MKIYIREYYSTARFTVSFNFHVTSGGSVKNADHHYSTISARAVAVFFGGFGYYPRIHQCKDVDVSTPYSISWPIF